ncbi:MAG: hypothetical protein IKP88_01305 [Lachnospiraceae bacterium]|nr:hypothetical protein [Lachnospiraceae bacterium]
MNKIKLSIIITICVCIIISGTSCDSSKEYFENDELIISDSAIKYEFPSDNLLKYKGIIVEKDYIVYVFDKFSEFTQAIKKNEDMKVFSEYFDESKRKYTTEWKLIEDLEGSYLVLFCDPSNYDFEAGIALSNYLKEDGETYIDDKFDITIITIRYLNNPYLVIRELADSEKRQFYEDGKWSDVFEKKERELD